MSDPQMPGPDPALRQLDPFVGEWEMEGRTAGSDEANIKGRAAYRWLEGGYFLEQRIQLDFAGMAQVDSLELIGYDPETGTFPSQVYSNMSAQPLPYTWLVDGQSVQISVSYGPLDATFHGGFGPDGHTFGGAWAPNPGADESVNVPYEISGRRVAANGG